MPRIARAVAVGFPHHITQRGNYKQTVFDKEEDYRQYLDWLILYRKKYSLKIWAYCLMSNHVHFIAVPMAHDSLAKTFNTLHMRYSQHMNMKKNAIGHLWQGRFFSCALDEKHLYAGIRYVENNPVRAGIVKKADEYKWSSASSHIHTHTDSVLSNDCYLNDAIKDWSSYLKEKEEKSLIDALKKSTRNGRPCGDTRFIQYLERLLGRRLRACPRGRPRSGVGKK